MPLIWFHFPPILGAPDDTVEERTLGAFMHHFAIGHCGCRPGTGTRSLDTQQPLPPWADALKFDLEPFL